MRKLYYSKLSFHLWLAVSLSREKLKTMFSRATCYKFVAWTAENQIMENQVSNNDMWWKLIWNCMLQNIYLGQMLSHNKSVTCYKTRPMKHFKLWSCESPLSLNEKSPCIFILQSWCVGYVIHVHVHRPKLRVICSFTYRGSHTEKLTAGDWWTNLKQYLVMCTTHRGFKYITVPPIDKSVHPVNVQ